MIVGTSPGRGDYMGSFLVDRSNGNYTRMSSPPWWGGMRYSRDGRVAAWVQPTSILRPEAEQELYTRRMDQPDAKTEATVITAHGGFTFAISDDGSRLAAVTGKRVAMTTKVDKNIIGGVVARVGSTVYDASIATQLKKIRDRLTT